ncbi:hypothetical protein [Streptomyces sp. BRA346]|uniref:hypothetical protein n=1 Tax=Streptomyces sp. BRA346 TaxID=2878199 RepID=UPI0040637B0D
MDASPRFQGNHVVDAIGISSYVGEPIIDLATGLALLTVCIIDPEPRTLADAARLQAIVRDTTRTTADVLKIPHAAGLLTHALFRRPHTRFRPPPSCEPLDGEGPSMSMPTTTPTTLDRILTPAHRALWQAADGFTAQEIQPQVALFSRSYGEVTSSSA